MAQALQVLLTIPSRAENVLVVRHALGGVAETLGLDIVESNDLYTAVTEACNNVVMHAYGGSEGPMRVDVRGSEAELRVVVSDRGSGMPAAETGGQGLGLHMIRGTAEHVTLESIDGGGTRLEMSFPHVGAASPDGAGPGRAQPAWSAEEDHEDAAWIVCSARALAVRVMPRALAAIAAAASFSMAAMRDVELLAGWLATHADDEGPVTALVEPSLRRLEVRLQPYSAGAGSLAGAAGDLILEDLGSEETPASRLALAISEAARASVSTAQPAASLD